MSARKSIVLLLAVSALSLLAACGGNSTHGATPVAPPSGGFSAGNLNGSYVFTVSGTDVNGAPYAIAGTFQANGSQGITAGTVDVNDLGFSASVPNSSINTSGSSYTLGVDGRGQIALGTSLSSSLGGMFGNITLDFVLQDSGHGLVIEFDNNGTGSGTIDLQAAGATPAGSYAFSFAGADATSGTALPFATVGNFTLGSGGTISGLEDFNDDGLAYPNQTVSGSVVLGPSSAPATSLVTSKYPSGQIFDVFAIDATHLKFIEMDASGVLSSGDAFSQSTTTLPATATNFAFTLEGSFPGAGSFSTAGGFIATDGAGNITNTSTTDVNNGGSVSTSPVAFSGAYTAAGTGRYSLALTSFPDGSSFVAYPYTVGTSVGLLLLEIDNSGIMFGAGYPQSSTAFSASGGYAMNLSGVFFSSGGGEEVDDISEFATSASGTTVTGVINENSGQGLTTLAAPNGAALSGTFAQPDSNGRGSISANSGSSSNNTTLNGGFGLTFYTVDGTTFPFIESDSNGQVSAGVFVQQSTPGASAGIAKSHNMFVPQPLIRPHAIVRKKN